MTRDATIDVQILFFARARELAGAKGARLVLPAGATVEAAARRLGDLFPALGDLLGSCRFAVNEEFAARDQALPAAAVIAVIPPVSGG